MAHYVALIDEAEGKFGVAIPDAPGCTAMGDTIDEAISNAAEALREWMADRLADGLKQPPPRSVAELKTEPSLIDDWSAMSVVTLIPLLLDAGRVVRANISVDAGLLTAIDDAARSRGLTRSAFLASAAREKIVAEG